jgi:transcriptional regulator of arginine metabolism
MVGRVLDYHQTSTEILATIAGDDTVFVAPKSVKNIQKLSQEIKKLLQG